MNELEKVRPTIEKSFEEEMAWRRISEIFIKEKVKEEVLEDNKK